MYDCMSVIFLLTHKDGEDTSLDCGTTDMYMRNNSFIDAKLQSSYILYSHSNSNLGKIF